MTQIKKHEPAAHTHKNDNKGHNKYTNRLSQETSPYLLQHAHNPVDWYPWGDEAFDLAKKNNRPLLVSIGYSTCHWCHVMAHESFEDEEIAAYINDHFVPVKVDREELPDIDGFYMSAVQLMTQGGGWPLNVWITPEKVPFFGGTYFPPRDGDRGAMNGFLTLLKRIDHAWQTRHAELIASGKKLTDYIAASLAPTKGSDLPGPDVVNDVIQRFKDIYDPENGGGGRAPKFPSSMNVRFLLDHWQATKDKQCLTMALTTLDKMAMGGIYDQIGGGFHRYATDAGWIVPHFEKMLYDNALLAQAYLDGWQYTDIKHYQRIAREILTYVLREMTGDEGGFYSATDADTQTPDGESVEGYFFTWTLDELQTVLTREQMIVAGEYYTLQGPAHLEGRYVPHRRTPHETVAETLNLTPEELAEQITEIKAVLFEKRQEKAPPFTDTKMLVSWNGLMISALARGGQLLKEPAFIAAAEKAAGFILDTLIENDRLYRCYNRKHISRLAYVDDYAYFVAGLVDLYKATTNARWLTAASRLADTMLTLFEDKAGGGLFLTSLQHEPLPAREKPGVDNPIPSPNAIAARACILLYEYTGDHRYLNSARQIFQAFGSVMSQNPLACSEMMLPLKQYYETVSDT